MPPTPLTFTSTSSPAEARAWFAALVDREPLRLSVIASVSEGLLVDPTRYDSPRWWAGRDPVGEVVAAFMHTPPHPLHVGLATAEQARELADHLAEAGHRLPGVGGLREPAEAFAEVWRDRTGCTVTTTMEVGAYDLPVRPALPWPVPGRYRLATEPDVALTDGWSSDFHAAIAGPQPSAPATARYAAAGRLGLWEDESGGPVSMAYASVPSGGVTRISGVWTPPEHRGHGYASAVVAALSAQRMDDGESCMLYTDLANPTSNGIYQALGYRRVGDNVHLAFD